MNSTSKMFKASLGAGLSLLLVFTLVGQTAAQICVQPPSNLISWWPGEGNANDIQNGNDATLQGGATFDAGVVAVQFTAWRLGTMNSAS